MIVDRFGREIVDKGDGTYVTEDITVVAPSLSQALNAFDGMAPAGWVEPIFMASLPVPADVPE